MGPRTDTTRASALGAPNHGTTHRRAADPIPDRLHDGSRRQGRSASLRKLRDGLRPPLTPATAEQEGWLSGRWLSPGHLGAGRRLAVLRTLEAVVRGDISLRGNVASLRSTAPTPALLNRGGQLRQRRRPLSLSQVGRRQAVLGALAAVMRGDISVRGNVAALRSTAPAPPCLNRGTQLRQRRPRRPLSPCVHPRDLPRDRRDRHAVVLYAFQHCPHGCRGRRHQSLFSRDLPHRQDRPRSSPIAAATYDAARTARACTAEADSRAAHPRGTQPGSTREPPRLFPLPNESPTKTSGARGRRVQIPEPLRGRGSPACSRYRPGERADEHAFERSGQSAVRASNTTE
jgi:hypothetical protein